MQPYPIPDSESFESMLLGDGAFHMRQEHKSPRYTTRWDELPTASVK
ncbi:MAG: DUF4113 domain-containing protein [Bacteroidales bacterium]|nr:DUF4113 domain-containing protein [Bacteroidales bacterium]